MNMYDWIKMGLVWMVMVWMLLLVALVGVKPAHAQSYGDRIPPPPEGFIECQNICLARETCEFHDGSAKLISRYHMEFIWICPQYLWISGTWLCPDADNNYYAFRYEDRICR